MPLVDLGVPDSSPKIAWGPCCMCGNPTTAPHRHGTSNAGSHVAIRRPWGKPQ